MPEFSRHIVSLFEKRATEPGGLLSGKDPTEFNPKEPIRLWIVQLGIIICTASLLSLALRKLRQPKVIAEVLGGIILGPTAFGRIPGFTEHIFPEDSRPYLFLTANIGLCLFLFLVGLEINADIIKRNARLSAMVALAGMAVPFGIGVGVSVPVYNRFIDPSVEFTHFMLFAGVAFSITAFPVLCRILTELKLLDTTVGIVVLSAGVGNDIIGWVLLALSVALVNAGSGLTALYILLVCVGWTLLILFPVKYGLKWIARVSGSIENGPSVLFMTVVMIVLFGSAFFTDIIGVHAIFGAFLAGLAVPREGGLAIHLTEKLEDMVSIIFLPLYFTLSGLSTDLGLLNDGITWGFTITILVTAFLGKFGACSLAARYAARFNWRESLAIGSLMSCKGLVELIVLNVGLNANILSKRVFSMFVLEALVLTFATTPLVEWFYPARLRVRSVDGARGKPSDDENNAGEKKLVGDGQEKTRFTVVLDKFEHLGGLMALVQLVNPPLPPPSTARTQSAAATHHPITIEALRILELSDRPSAVMKGTKPPATMVHADPLLSAFRMFSTLNNISTAPSLEIVKYDEIPDCIVQHARDFHADMVLVPWLPPMHSAGTSHTRSPSTAPHAESAPVTPTAASANSPNPFDRIFASNATHQDVSSSALHSYFVRNIFARAATDIALFVDQAMITTNVVLPSEQQQQQHLFLPFFGGPDDRLALEFVIQLCEANPRLGATILRVEKREGAAPSGEENMLTVQSEHVAGPYPDTFYGAHTTQTRLQSDTADNIAWAKYAGGETNDAGSDDSSSVGAQSQHPRIEFKTLVSPTPLKEVLQEALKHTNPTPTTQEATHVRDGTTTDDEKDDISTQGDGIAVLPPASQTRARRQSTTTPASSRGPLIVVTGRSRRLAVENHRAELRELMDQYGPIDGDARKTLGDVASAFMVARVGSGIVVVQKSVEAE